MRRLGVWAAIALVVVTNAVVLAGVAYNRSETSEALVVMTERELGPTYSIEENSGMALRLNWRQQSIRVPRLELAWFDTAKLEALGFDCSMPLDSEYAALHYRKATAREAFVVLEYEGKTWGRWLAEAEKAIGATAAGIERQEKSLKDLENAEERYKRMRTVDSRLVAVDVGPDPLQLREQYPDRSRFIVAPAKVRLVYKQESIDSSGTRQAPYLGGYISKVVVDVLNVPRDKRAVLDNLGHKWMDQGPRYSVTVQYGKRYEPWIVDISRMPPPVPELR
jgi:hypothetical protein